MSKNVVFNLELGHNANVRSQKTDEGFTHDWEVFVQGPPGTRIEAFVEKVVFYLHSSFSKPKRVMKEPPFKVCEKGYGAFNLPIEIYFRSNGEPRKAKFDYDLYLQSLDSAPIHNTRKEKLTFLKPNEEFKKKLLQGGGVEVSSGEESRLNEKSSKSRPSSGAKTKPVARHHASSNVTSNNHGTEVVKKSSMEIKKDVPKSKDSDQFRALFGEIIKKGSNPKIKEKPEKKAKNKVVEVAAASKEKSLKENKSPSSEKESKKERKEEKDKKREKESKEKEKVKMRERERERSKEKEREKKSHDKKSSKDREEERKRDENKKDNERREEREKKEEKERKKEHTKRASSSDPSGDHAKKRKDEREGKKHSAEVVSRKGGSEEEEKKKRDQESKERERERKEKKKKDRDRSREREKKPSPLPPPPPPPPAPPPPVLKEEKKKSQVSHPSPHSHPSSHSHPSPQPLPPPQPQPPPQHQPQLQPPPQPQVQPQPPQVPPPKPVIQATRGRPRKDAKRTLVSAPPLPPPAPPPISTPPPLSHPTHPLPSSKVRPKTKPSPTPPSTQLPPAQFPPAPIAKTEPRSKSSSRSRSPSLSISSSSSAKSRSSSPSTRSTSPEGSPPHSSGSQSSHSRSPSRSSSRSRSLSRSGSRSSSSKSPSVKSGSRSASRSKSPSSSSSCDSSPSRPSTKDIKSEKGKKGTINPLKLLAEAVSESSSDSDGKETPTKVVPQRGKSTPLTAPVKHSPKQLPVRGGGKSRARLSISSEEDASDTEEVKDKRETKRPCRSSTSSSIQHTRDSGPGDPPNNSITAGNSSYVAAKGKGKEPPKQTPPHNMPNGSTTPRTPSTSSGDASATPSNRFYLGSDYLKQLRDLKDKIIMNFSNPAKVQEIVNIIGYQYSFHLHEHVEHVEITLNDLDEQTIKKLQHCLS